MHVLATAGHVDHGKSTLVRALTGMEPDRFAEEHRRGMTIDLGYAWTTLAGGEQLAFVDVPGHQRFIGNMLAGLGPVPAVLFVVSAGEGWSRQSSEHASALEALGVQHALLAVTRSDRTDPAAARVDALARLHACGLDDVEAVAVSAPTGAGLAALRSALGRLVGRLPTADHAAPVRLWVDRSFSVAGSGTVVTGTLAAGAVTLGDKLALRNQIVIVRGLQALGQDRGSVSAVSRVALNLRGVGVGRVSRGDVLLSPNTFLSTPVIDVRLVPVAQHVPRERAIGHLPSGEFVLHVGTAAVAVRVRTLGDDIARITLARALPLRAGDRAVLRDPGRQTVAAGVLVLDADPPPFTRRGAAAARARQLQPSSGQPDVGAEVARRGIVRRSHLVRLGIDTSSLADVGGWLLDPTARRRWEDALPREITAWAHDHPLEPAMPRSALSDALDVPEGVIDELAAGAGCVIDGGRVTHAAGPSAATLGRAEAGLRTLLERLERHPFAAPDHDALVELGLGQREVAVAVRRGRLLQLATGVLLAPGAPARAASILAGLDQPFTMSAARTALGTTRRVAVPLLEYLDSQAVTERVSATTRRVQIAPDHLE